MLNMHSAGSCLKARVRQRNLEEIIHSRIYQTAQNQVRTKKKKSVMDLAEKLPLGTTCCFAQAPPTTYRLEFG